ncbi:MAG: hypothetical protein ACJAYV_002121 [Oleispira sp.]|jgi:hypothetical protein
MSVFTKPLIMPRCQYIEVISTVVRLFCIQRRGVDIVKKRGHL